MLARSSAAGLAVGACLVRCKVGIQRTVGPEAGPVAVLEVGIRKALGQRREVADAVGVVDKTIVGDA